MIRALKAIRALRATLVPWVIQDRKALRALQAPPVLKVSPALKAIRALRATRAIQDPKACRAPRAPRDLQEPKDRKVFRASKVRRVILGLKALPDRMIPICRLPRASSVPFVRSLELSYRPTATLASESRTAPSATMVMPTLAMTLAPAESARDKE